MENIASEKEMIQTPLLPELELEEERPSKSLHLASLYKVRYVHPETGLVLEGCQYPEGGGKKLGNAQYLYNSGWVDKQEIPEFREDLRVKQSTLEFFMKKLKENMKTTNNYWKNQGRKILGVNEFDEKRNCTDKLRAQFNKQVERYGYKCPITHIEFTTIRKMEKTLYQRRIISNISADRLLDLMNYTKQNVLFTSVGWNLARQNFYLKDIKKLFSVEFAGRYEKIVRERFPNIDEGSADV